MTLVDRAVISVTAGTGGSGCMSFRREMFVPKGGPDGGDGGRGGSVHIEAHPQLTTLLDYSYRTHWKAPRGKHGSGSNKTGKAGVDVTLPVPAGTVVRDLDTGDVLGELLEVGDTLCVARGGRGGRGNAAFATPTHRSPREWEPGKEGESRRIELVLKLIADVGLLGEPNAGKSTLLSVLSAAKPKIADYPFTTLEPHLGVVAVSPGTSFVLADIPGIIEGAHAGKGLGDKFLQHVERTKVLAYLVPIDADDVQVHYDLLRHEAQSYSADLAAKPHVVVFTKSDLVPEDAQLPGLVAPDAEEIIVISAAANRNLDRLRHRLWELLSKRAAAPPADDEVQPWS